MPSGNNIRHEQTIKKNTKVHGELFFVPKITLSGKCLYEGLAIFATKVLKVKKNEESN